MDLAAALSLKLDCRDVCALYYMWILDSILSLDPCLGLHQSVAAGLYQRAGKGT